MRAPLAWTIAGMDPCTGAGIVADCRTFTVLAVQGYAITTAVTAQNGFQVLDLEPMRSSLIIKQFQALKKLGEPKAIKIGLLPNQETAEVVFSQLEFFKGPLIYDPILRSSSSYDFLLPEAITALEKLCFDRVTILTPNISEAERLLNINISDPEDMLAAAQQLCANGVANVILKGGHLPGAQVHDLWCDQHGDYAWLISERIPIHKMHGSGCAFSAALTAFMARDYPLLDAWVLARMSVQQGIRKPYFTTKEMRHLRITASPQSEDLPSLSYALPKDEKRVAFLPCKEPIGFYPIVDNLEMLRQCLNAGVRSVQLRIKDRTKQDCRTQILQAVRMCQDQPIQLFINDYWELAIELGAYGVHLGQSDLHNCNIEALLAAKLRLGISTHSYTELARAHALKPSYIALGPIYPTQSKIMPFAPQGLTTLRQWRALVACQLVAIGGINLENSKLVGACNVDGICVISAIANASMPELAQWMALFSHEKSFV
jgi:hydroxymethylpyrimidine kinase/phosphomethylpyrimidine kinase/thiamine-phosphate diphosphorylase